MHGNMIVPVRSEEFSSDFDVLTATIKHGGAVCIADAARIYEHDAVRQEEGKGGRP